MVVIYLGIIGFLTFLYSYWNILLSWFLSKFLKLEITVRSFSLPFRFHDVSFYFAESLTIHVDLVEISRDRPHPTRFFVIKIGDVRVEYQKVVKDGKRSEMDKMERREKLKARLQRLTRVGQYCGLAVNRIHLVILQFIPESMLHVTIDGLSIEVFRSRDGWQLETSCQLIQAKILRRNILTGSSLVAEASLPLQLSVDVEGTRVNKIGLRVANPAISVTNDVFDVAELFLNERAKYLDENPSSEDLAECFEEPPPLINVDWQLILNVDLESLDIRYSAISNPDDLRHLSLNIKSVQVGKFDQNYKLEVNALTMMDQWQHSAMRSASLVVQLAENEWNGIECRISSDEVRAKVSFEDVKWWKEHFDSVGLARFSKPKPTKPPPSPPSSTKIERCVEFYLELASINCNIIDFEKQKLKLNAGFVSFEKTGNGAFEIGIELLSFGNENEEFEENKEPSFETHRWGESIFVGACLVQWDEEKGKVATIGIDDLKMEWSERFARQLNDVLRILENKEEAKEKKMRKEKGIGIRVTINRIALITISNKTSYAGICCSKIDMMSSDLTAEIYTSLQMVRGAVGRIEEGKEGIEIDEMFGAGRTRLVTPKERDSSPTRRWNQKAREGVNEKARRAADEGLNPKLFLSTDDMKIWIDRRSTVIDSITLQIPTSCFFVSWSPHLHLILLHSYRSAKSAFTIPTTTKSASRRVPRKRHFFIDATNCVEVQLELARDHRMLWRADGLNFERVEGQMTVSSSLLHILMNAQKIVTVVNPLIAVRQYDEEMTKSRLAFATLHSNFNKTWTWAADRFVFQLPFEFNFAQVFDEFINMIKWIKIVHEVRKREFTIESPLPSDFQIDIKEVVLQLEDDDFEIRLKSSFELKEDEVYEIERRNQILEERLRQIKKSVPLIPKEVMEQLEEKMLTKNSEIYVERWRMSEFEKSPLFVSTWKGWSMRAFADLTLHGTKRCLELMKAYDPLSPMEEAQKYSTLWARAVEFDVDEWSVNFKDYPMKYLDIKDLHFFGTLVGAESFSEDGRSLRENVIEVPEPWPILKVQRNMSPLKFYYDMQCASKDFTCTYGPCWEPCLSMISLMWNNISSPSRDPSPPLPFWDKMRFLLHGRVLWSSEKFVTTMLASNNPYNETETVEMCWDEFGLDWALGEIRIKSGLRVFLRTASRYDDSQVLTLPDVRLKVLLGWECVGDPHDHHSVVLCSPARLPQYSSLDEHDTYRQFRSSCVNVTLNFDVASGSCTTDDKMPNVLLYSNTFRCIEQFLKSLTTKNRNVRRGKVFGNKVLLKPQLSKHFGKLQVSVSLPKVLVTYWMSHSSPYGFRIFSDGLQLTASFRQIVQHSSVNREMNVQRRKVYTWSTHHMTCTWWATQIHVYGENSRPKQEENPSEDTFLVGFGRVQYARETYPGKEAPLHKVTAYDLKMSWTAGNRNACLTIADGVHRAHMLRRILSNDAVKTLNVHLEEETVKDEQQQQEQNQKQKKEEKTHRRGYSVTEANPWMLNQLIDEVGTKLVAHCEQASDVPIDSLLGVQQSTADDVKLLNWQIDLYNSQLVLKGCERDGFVLVSAAKAQLLQNIHRSVWKDGLLLSKKSWKALLSGMQYFAPISSAIGGTNQQMFKWLGRDVIEEKTQDMTGFADDFVQKYSGAGEAVGGVVQQTSSSSDDQKMMQLQRIVSRCSCQIYFCYFSDELKTDSSEDISVPKQADEKSRSMVGTEDAGIDVLTLKHNMLEATSNSDQYEMVVDIVNNLVLFVDPNKKELGEKRRRLRFECQMINMQELRGKIMRYQSDLREIVSLSRYLERQLFYLNQGEIDKVEDYTEPEAKKEQLESEAEETKHALLTVSEKLATYISSYKQRQINLRDVESNLTKEVEVVRRFEVCFEDCIWKLTESDGQIALAQTQIRNFLYTRTIREGNCGDHLFEVGSVRVANLLPDTIYKHALHRDETRYSRQPAIRLFMRDLPPVGGICVKEHFELNIAPMIAEITHRLFDKMMRFFFPGRNIHTTDSLDPEQETSTFSFTRKIASSLNMKTNKTATEKMITKQVALDDIDRMRERADQVNHFMYIKIPEVSFIVSYKGNKDKNLIDVHQFNFIFPLCEFHERNWTWLDLALAVKSHCKRVLVQQFMRQKLLRNRISNFSIEPPPQTVSEEEKKRIAVGVTSADQKQKK